MRRVYLRLWENSEVYAQGVPPSLGDLWRMCTVFTSVFGRLMGECAPSLPPSLGELGRMMRIVPPSLGDLGENGAHCTSVFGRL